MDIELTHKLEFKATEIQSLGEIKAMVDAALADGFHERTPIFIRAGTDDREHDYYFYASVGKAEGMPVREPKP